MVDTVYNVVRFRDMLDHGNQPNTVSWASRVGQFLEGKHIDVRKNEDLPGYFFHNF